MDRQVLEVVFYLTVKEQVYFSVIILLGFNSKDISVFTFGFFCLQLPRFVFCICAVRYDDRGVYASRRCLSDFILFVRLSSLVLHGR